MLSMHTVNAAHKDIIGRELAARALTISGSNAGTASSLHLTAFHGSRASVGPLMLYLCCPQMVTILNTAL